MFKIVFLNVKIQQSVWFWMSKYDIECHNTIFDPSSNVKIGFWMSQYDIRPKFESVNSIFLMTQYDIRPNSKCQNGILNVKPRYSARFWMSKNEKRKTKSNYWKPKNKYVYRKTKRENKKRKTNKEKWKTKNKPTSPCSILLKCLWEV